MILIHMPHVDTHKTRERVPILGRAPALFLALHGKLGGMKRSESQIFSFMLLADETYRSFTSLGMTRLRFAVILSEAVAEGLAKR